ncbi:MAG: hypothetical protein HY660_12665 [Armatimonadetes bacterium]|nr:hypothetical protein [Armatimonadota bacterium]
MSRRPNGSQIYRFELYDTLARSAAAIYDEVRRAAADAGVTDDMRGRIGLTGAVSSCHGLLTRRVSAAIDAGARKVIENSALDVEVRRLVKSYYGDDYDGAMIATCEAALWVAYDALFTPPLAGRGENYRTRYIAPYERHMHHQAGYGRPFPPRYKDLYADRGVTAGEMGMAGKRLENLDTVIVPMAGAEYPCHGIRYHPVPLLSRVDAEATAATLADQAAIHAPLLAGFASLGYDTPGYGHGARDPDGTPLLQRRIAALARRYNVPYVTDNAWGVPFVGTDIRATGADVMTYSMDKAAGAPTVGLIVGRENAMLPIRRALGIHGDRWGTTRSHGKAAYVTVDPGKEALLGGIAAMEVLLERPESFQEPLDHLYALTREEFQRSDLRQYGDGWLITRSHNSMAVEVNYEQTWDQGCPGFPIFTIEDMYAGSNVVQNAMKAAGLVPTIGYDANIFISLGMGTTDEDGRLMEKEARVMVRALFRALEIIGRHSGVREMRREAARS